MSGEPSLNLKRAQTTLLTPPSAKRSLLSDTEPKVYNIIKYNLLMDEVNEQKKTIIPNARVLHPVKPLIGLNNNEVFNWLLEALITDDSAKILAQRYLENFLTV